MSKSPGIGLIVRRSLRHHALSTTITAVSVALATGLVMSVFAIDRQTRDAFTGGPVGFDAVLGARGSQLQLVLNTVFQLETSPGNIPWSVYTAISHNPSVSLAIPFAVGDNYHGFRIVGTTTQMFTDFEYTKGHKLTPEAGGRIFNDTAKEGVIGAMVARQTGLRVGDTFHPYHGVIYDTAQMHKEQFTVVGVLKQTNSPSDRVVWIPIDADFRIAGHVLRGSGTIYRPQPGVEIPDANKEVSAVMLKFRTAKTGFMLDQQINKQGKDLTLAWPIARVMADLFNKIGWVSRVLQLVAYLVVVVAAGSILASIYNTMNERRREFAILRALGARRWTVSSAIVLEAAAITLMGIVGGFVVYGAILAVVTEVIRVETGVVLNAFQISPPMIIAPIGMLLIGALAGLAPAFKAYGTDVASNLSPTS